MKKTMEFGTNLIFGCVPYASNGKRTIVRMAAKAWRVVGRVQGVGFRAFVLRTAEDLGIAGEVWNTREGDVRVDAFHESNAMLDEMELRLRSGPGHVAEVFQEASPRGSYPEFIIGRTR